MEVNYFTILYWFCHTSNESVTVYMCSPSWTPPPTSLPVPSLWVIPVHQPQASCILHRTWTGDSFLIWYYTYFNAILPNHPTLSLKTITGSTILRLPCLFSNLGLLKCGWYILKFCFQVISYENIRIFVISTCVF